MAESETTMILRTGKTRNEPAHRAFTLIELIAVMALLIIVIATAAPSLGNFFRGRSLDSEARRMLSLTRQGQSRAVSEGVPMTLWIDAAQRRYGLEEESSYTEQDPKAVDFPLDRDLRIEVVNSNSSNKVSAANTSRTLSGNTSSGGKHGNLPMIRFLPDGFADDTSPQAVGLFERDGATLWLTRSTNRLNYEIRNQLNQ
jgi:type II secretion system protein H